MRVCIERLGVAPLFLAAAAEQGPAFDVVRVLAHAQRERIDFLVERRRREAALEVERGRRADLHVQQHCCDRQQQGHRERGAARALPQRRQQEGRGDRDHRENGGDKTELHHQSSLDSEVGSIAMPRFSACRRSRAERLRTTKATVTPPQANRASGPNHSGHVAGSTRGW